MNTQCLTIRGFCMYYKFTLKAKNGTKVVFRVRSDLDYFDNSENLPYEGIEFDTIPHYTNFINHQNLKDYLQSCYEIDSSQCSEYMRNLEESTQVNASGKRYVWTNFGYFLDAIEYFNDHAFTELTAVSCNGNGEVLENIDHPKQLYNEIVAKFRQHPDACPSTQFLYHQEKEERSISLLRKVNAQATVGNAQSTSASRPAKSVYAPRPPKPHSHSNSDADSDADSDQDNDQDATKILLAHPNSHADKGLSSSWKIALFILLGIAFILSVVAITWGSMGLLTAPAALAVTNFVAGAFGVTLASIPQAAFITILVTATVLALGAVTGIFLIAKQPTKEVLSGPSSGPLTYSKLNGTAKALDENDAEQAFCFGLFNRCSGTNAAPQQPLLVVTSPAPSHSTQAPPLL
jgi:hypothetical protein